MKSFRFACLLVVAVMCVLVGCVYDYGTYGNLSNLEKDLIVIEGDIIVGGMTTVNVSHTSDLKYYPEVSTKASDVFPYYLQCEVWVENTDGEVWPGKDSLYIWKTDHISGYRVYKQSYVVDTRDLPVDGEYRLCVSCRDRGEYCSQFKKVLKAQDIESLEFSFAPDTSEIKVLLCSRGGEEHTPYYRWTYEECWDNSPPLMPNMVMKGYSPTLLTAAQQDSLSPCFQRYASESIMLESTERLKDNVVRDKIITKLYKQQRRVNNLYSIAIYQTPLDKEGYEYYSSMRTNSEELGGLYDPYPSEFRGNIVSTTYPDEIVVGYVNVCTRTEKRIFLDGSALKLFDRKKCVEFRKMTRKYLTEDSGYGLYDCYQDEVRTSEGIEYVRNCAKESYWSPIECVGISKCSPKPDFWPR